MSASVKVVLPWSTCAMIAIFRISIHKCPQDDASRLERIGPQYTLFHDISQLESQKMTALHCFSGQCVRECRNEQYSRTSNSKRSQADKRRTIARARSRTQCSERIRRSDATELGTHRTPLYSASSRVCTSGRKCSARLFPKCGTRRPSVLSKKRRGCFCATKWSKCTVSRRSPTDRTTKRAERILRTEKYHPTLPSQKRRICSPWSKCPLPGRSSEK